MGWNNYGLRLACGSCGYRWLKTPGEKRKDHCPNDATRLQKVVPSPWTYERLKRVLRRHMRV